MPKVRLTRNILEESSIEIDAPKPNQSGEIPKAIVKRLKRTEKREEKENTGGNQDHEVIFPNAEDDPEIQKVEQEIEKLVNKAVSEHYKFLYTDFGKDIPENIQNDSELWDRTRSRISKEQWENFVRDNPEKAEAYKDTIEPIKQAKIRYEARQRLKAEQTIQVKELSSDTKADLIEENKDTKDTDTVKEKIKKRSKKIHAFNINDSGRAIYRRNEKGEAVYDRSEVKYNGEDWEVSNFDEQTGDVHLQREEKRNLAVSQEELFKKNSKDIRSGDSVLYGDETWELLKLDENTQRAYLEQKVVTHIMVPQRELFKQNPEYANPNLPIAEGEIFDPEEEIKSFKPGLRKNQEGEHDDVNVIPKENRREELVEFKKKLAYQMEMMSKLQEDVIAFIRENPDATVAKIYNKLLDFEKEGRVQMSDDNRKLVIDLIEAYVEKHQKIKETREKYPDDRDLFSALFGFKPQGRFEIIKGLITFHVKFENTKDYVNVYSYDFKQGRVDNNLKNQALENGQRAALLPRCLIPDLRGAVSIEKLVNGPEESRVSFDHEEQHAIERLFGGRIFWMDLKYWRESLEKKKNSQEGITRKDIEEVLRFAFKKEREAAQNDYSRDEIMAIFKGGDASSQLIFYTMVSASTYDFWSKSSADFKERIKKELEKGVGYEVDEYIIDEISHEVNEVEYRKLLRDGVDSLFLLTESGYSRDQAIAMLIHEPLSRWKKTVARVLGKKGLHSQNYQSLNTILIEKEKEEEEKRKVVKTEFGSVTKLEQELGEEALKLRREKMANRRSEESLQSEEKIQSLKERLNNLAREEIRAKEEILTKVPGEEKFQNLADIQADVESLKKPLRKQIRRERVKQKAKSLWNRLRDMFNS